MRSARGDETNLPLELLDRTNFDVLPNIHERLPQF